jgi:SAM-dependent methyltransferase
MIAIASETSGSESLTAAAHALPLETLPSDPSSAAPSRSHPVPPDPPALVFAPNSLRPFAQASPHAAAVHDCQQSLAPFALAAGNGTYADRTFTIHRCTVCDLGFTSPIPTEETSHLLYESRESNDFQPNDSSLVARLKALATRRDAHSFLRPLTLPQGPLLDYGCGNAAFATALQHLLPEREVFAADLQEAPPAALSPTRYLSYDTLDESPQRYAFILCRHVLEHSYDPVGLLTRLSHLLLPGGILALEVPSLETPMARLFGRFWDNFYVPFHPIHFTPLSLHATARAAGLHVLRQGGAEMPKVGRSLHNLVGGSYHLGLFALGMMLHPLQIAVGRLTGRPVCLRLWAQKL